MNLTIQYALSFFDFLVEQLRQACHQAEPELFMNWLVQFLPGVMQNKEGNKSYLYMLYFVVGGSGGELVIAVGVLD